MLYSSMNTQSLPSFPLLVQDLPLLQESPSAAEGIPSTAG